MRTEDIDLCRSLEQETDFEYENGGIGFSAKNNCLFNLAKELKKPELCDEIEFDIYLLNAEKVKNDCINYASD